LALNVDQVNIVNSTWSWICHTFLVFRKGWCMLASKFFSSLPYRLTSL